MPSTIPLLPDARSLWKSAAFPVRWLPLPSRCHWRHGPAGWHCCKAPQSSEEVLHDAHRALSGAVRLRSGNVKIPPCLVHSLPPVRPDAEVPLHSTVPEPHGFVFSFDHLPFSFMLSVRDTPGFLCAPSARGIPRSPRPAHSHPPAFRPQSGKVQSLLFRPLPSCKGFPHPKGRTAPTLPYLGNGLFSVLPVSVCVSASVPSADLPAFRQPHSTSVQYQRLRLPLPQAPFLQKTCFFSPFSTAGGLGFSPKCVWISKRYACKTSSTDFHRLPHAESIMIPFL